MQSIKSVIWNSTKSVGQHLQFVRNLSSSRCSIVRTSRLNYLLSYPTLLVNPDGSTLTIRYHEPREIIKLPFDTSTLSDIERSKRMELRKPKTRLQRAEDVEKVKYDAKKYLKYVKK